MIKDSSRISLHGKDCWLTARWSVLGDIETLTSQRARQVPYIYVDPEISYYVTDKGRFFTVKYSKTFSSLVIMENEWHIRQRDKSLKPPFVIAKAGFNKRVELVIAKCVYCAFVSGRWIDDKLYFEYKDNSNQNPSLSNLKYERGKGSGLVDYSSDSWIKNYKRFLLHVCCAVDNISVEDAEDCVQTAFVEAFINSCPYSGWLKSDTEADERHKRETLWRKWSWEKGVNLMKRQRRAIDLDNCLLRNDELDDIAECGEWCLKQITAPSQHKVLEMFLAGFSEMEIAKEMKFVHARSVNASLRKSINTLKTKYQSTIN